MEAVQVSAGTVKELSVLDLSGPDYQRVPGESFLLTSKTDWDTASSPCRIVYWQCMAKCCDVAMQQAGEPYDAVQAFRDLQKSGLTPNVITWSSVISSLSKQRRKGTPFAQLAYKLWKELEATGLATGNAALYAAGVGAVTVIQFSVFLQNCESHEICMGEVAVSLRHQYLSSESQGACLRQQYHSADARR